MYFVVLTFTLATLHRSCLARPKPPRLQENSCICQLGCRMLSIEQFGNGFAWARHAHQVDLTNQPSIVLQCQSPMPQTINLATVQVSTIPQVTYHKYWDTQPVMHSRGQAKWMPSHHLDDTRQLAHGYNTGNYPAHCSAGNYPTHCNVGNYPSHCDARKDYPASNATHLESSGTVDGKGIRRQRGRRLRIPTC